jgi:hypothetical protein
VLLTWINLVILMLAAFRLTHLIVFDSITAPLRRPLERIPFIGELVGCYWCCGVWVAAFLVILQLTVPRLSFPLLLLLAVAGGQALLESLVQRD